MNGRRIFLFILSFSVWMAYFSRFSVSGCIAGVGVAFASVVWFGNLFGTDEWILTRRAGRKNSVVDEQNRGSDKESLIKESHAAAEQTRLSTRGSSAAHYVPPHHETSPSETSSVALLLHRMRTLVVLLPVFIAKIVWAGLQIAFLSLRLNLSLNPAVVLVKTGRMSLTEATFLANMITLTPGTLSLDFDPDRGELYVHWIDITTEDPDRIEGLVTGGLKPWIERLFRGTGEL
jgi:multisubunit Na+/H+ antiporter MnhE subunit